MEADFWHERWAENRIGFHGATVNPLLTAHFAALGLAPQARVFVPLCGKTLDIAWLMARGHRVVGAELSRLAIEQLFAELGVDPVISPDGALTRFSAPGIEILVGDIFDLTAEQLGQVDAVYDRAALVALPGDMRARYAEHLHALTGGAPQLVICFDYDQTATSGPPFSVGPAEIAAVYGRHYTLTELETRADPVGLRGSIPARETVWHLA